jgi:hypothetical protein
MADRYQDRPFPADNYRGGNQNSSKGESDPLAELARLIGQTDPFAGMGRANQQVQQRGNARDQLQPQPRPQQPQPQMRPQQPQPQMRPPQALEPDDGPGGPPSWIQRAAAQQQPQDLDSARQEQRFAPEPMEQRQAPPFAPEPRQAPPFAPEPVARQAPAFAPEPMQAPSFAPEPMERQAPPFAPGPMERPSPPFAPGPMERQAPQFAPGPMGQPAPSFAAGPDPLQQGAGPERYDEALYGQLPSGSRDLLQEAEFDDPYAYQDEYGEGMLDQERPRRGGMFTVAVVLALAVVGTGAAFAYRAYVGTERNGEPPIIRADAGPNKMIPPSQSGDGSGKLIQDRMTGSTERLVSREEQPVDLKDGRSGPRVIFPMSGQGASSPPPASAPPLNRPVANSGMSASGMSANVATTVAANAAMPANTGSSSSAGAGGASMGNGGGMGGDEPRKIRTVSVKGDQTDAAATPAAKPTPATRSMAAATPVRAQPVAASSSAPMSIAPQAAAPADSRTRMASTTAAATTAAAQPIAPVAVTGTDGYLVQVSSQTSEADAEKSFKSLQGKYPDLLGSREPMIKQADVKGKTVYRAMVGPFASSGEANQFCNGLKTAGGQCYVPKN